MKTKPANWPAPKNIHALSTMRLAGTSQAPYDSFNIAHHVGDITQQVQQNRHILGTSLKLEYEPEWLNQTHSTVCVVAEEESNRNADAAITRSEKHPLVILTADCLPITLCSTSGDEIAAVHAGWRGLRNGIIENTIKKMNNKTHDLMAWIGPAICGTCYEVGEEVLHAFTSTYPDSEKSFTARGDKWLANLPQIAEAVLKAEGINAIYQSNLCTFELNDMFYSYRKQAITGRIATLIWINNQQ